jgi:subtilase family serine protease
MFNKLSIDYIVIILVILYLLFFLNSCSTTPETGQCILWSTKEVKETHCTRMPNRICVDEIYEKPFCLVREKDE